MFEDIYDIWYTPWWKSFTFYSILGVGALAAGIAGWYITKRFIISRKRSSTPAQKALAELEKLKKHPLKTQGDYAHVYSVLMRTMKSCSNTVSATDQEYRHTIENLATAQEYKKYSVHVVERAEQIKFAQVTVDITHVAADIAHAQRLIQSMYVPHS